jgi:hypothetical protein
MRNHGAQVLHKRSPQGGVSALGQTLLRVNLQSIHLARLVGGIGLDPLKYATHSMRRTKATTKLWISHH